MSDGTPTFGYSDDNFRRRLVASLPSLELVAEGLARAGVSAEVSEYRFRENVQEIAGYTEGEKDLVLRKSRFCVEVKSRDLSWTTPGDYPYGTAFVDTVAGFERKRKKPIAYVLVSNRTGAMACVPEFTCTGWTQERRRDRERGILDNFYMVDRKLLVDLDWVCRLSFALETSSPDKYVDVLNDHGFGNTSAARYV